MRLSEMDISAMAEAMDNEELGAAMRLLAHIMKQQKPMPFNRARSVAQVSRSQWQEIEPVILSHFIQEGDMLSHKCLTLPDLPSVGTQERVLSQPGTLPLPLVEPVRTVVAPAYASRDVPERISIKGTAFKMIADIFAPTEQSPNTARAVLAGLLKAWPEGDVYAALNAAQRAGDIADPRSWLTAHLQRNSTPLVARRFANGPSAPPSPAPRKPRQVVSAEAAGVSAQTAQKISDLNRTLTITVD